jgi:drug/metabolite transporter (DMT)-like permease
VTLIIPVGGVLLAWLLLGEVLTAGEAAGMLLIALGLMIIDGRALGLVAAWRPAARPNALRRDPPRPEPRR